MFDNYGGGFVRRGLFGELILGLYHLTGINPNVVIAVVMAASYILLTWWLVRRFRQRGWCWYFLLSCMMLGSFAAYALMMKRMFLVVLFLGVVCLFRCRSRRAWPFVVLGNALTAFGLLCYEPFAFFSIPMFLLLSHARCGSWMRAIMWWLPSMAVFVFCFVSHGDAAQLDAVRRAADEFLVPGNTYMMDFLGWSSIDIFRLHFKYNYCDAPGGISAVLVNIFMLLYCLYIATNGVLGFQPQTDGTRRQTRTLFGLVFFQLLMQAPMFIILSTDYGRICCFSVTTAYIVFLALDEQTLSRLFPERATVWFNRICERMNDYIPPRPSKLILLMLFVGIASWQGDIGRAYQASMVGKTEVVARHLFDIVKEKLSDQ